MTEAQLAELPPAKTVRTSHLIRLYAVMCVNYPTKLTSTASHIKAWDAKIQELSAEIDARLPGPAGRKVFEEVQ
jgi:hypothetical protein